jgi:hypothetical protein
MQNDVSKLFEEGPAQGDLFANLPPPPPKTPQVDVAKIRRKLERMLDDVRAAQDGSPWPYETTRLNKLLFPQMSNWLPKDERDRLRLEFETELKRLNLCA